MSDFKAKMYQICFPLGCCPRPCWGSLQHFPDLQAVFKYPTSKGKEDKGGEVEGFGPPKNFGMTPWTDHSKVGGYAPAHISYTGILWSFH